MRGLLRKRLKGKEAEIARSIDECGERITMLLYGVKSQSAFRKWAKTHIEIKGKDTIVPLDNPDNNNPFAYVTGSAKSILNRNSKDLILNFYERFGPEATKKQFHLKQDTLENLIHSSKEPRTEKVKPIIKLEVRISHLEKSIGEIRDRLDKWDLKSKIQDENYKEAMRLVKQSNTNNVNVSAFIAKVMGQIVEMQAKERLDKILPISNLLPITEEPDLNVSKFVDFLEDIVVEPKIK